MKKVKVMTESTSNFDIILYYTRTVTVKPVEPSFSLLMSTNPELSMDELLDIYSALKAKYTKKLTEYEAMKTDSLVSTYTFISEDENFMENVKNFEKNDFFVEWSKESERIINQAIVNILHTV
jgi:hypothetical protein